MKHRAAILSQGDEVLTGQTVDSNAAWLSERLTDIGFDMVLHLTVGDRQADIEAAMRQAHAAADVVIGTGGLGPTQDDLTAASAASVLGCELAFDQQALQNIKNIYAWLGTPMPDSNEKQAWLPSTATALYNAWGTAPGFHMDHGLGVGFYLPGVPREMRSFWKHLVRPALVERFELRPGRLVTLRCLGVHESKLAELCAPFESTEGFVLGFRTNLPENQVKLRVSPDVPTARVDEVVARLRAAIGKPVFGVDCGSIQQVLVQELTNRGETLATAESCTGGQVSAAITGVPGSSAVFLEGSCIYSNEAKIRTCGVDPDTLAEHGAVSEQVAVQLAQGIRDRAGATYGLSTTGIAGPGGGTPDKPVGTVHIACAHPGGVYHRKLSLRGNRDRIQRLTVGSVLDMLRRHHQGFL
jgi:nicotinamide-nucleotide amidase